MGSSMFTLLNHSMHQEDIICPYCACELRGWMQESYMKPVDIVCWECDKIFSIMRDPSNHKNIIVYIDDYIYA